MCCDEWEDASNVSLGYLWFEQQAQLNYSQAVSFCEERLSYPIEINSKNQLNFVINKINLISENVENLTLGGAPAKAWWGSATDKEEEGTWKWSQSGKAVEEFVWGGVEPNNYGDEHNFCLLNWHQYKGADVAGSHMMYPLCQQKR